MPAQVSRDVSIVRLQWKYRRDVDSCRNSSKVDDGISSDLGTFSSIPTYVSEAVAIPREACMGVGFTRPDERLEAEPKHHG
jgi:hypothetical protein